MKETIIQFGEGNFLRGFFDWFLDGMNKQGLYDGKAVVIQPRAGGKVGPLNEQGCRYNLYLRGIENGHLTEQHSLIESISRGIDPYKDFEGYMALADSPDFRFIVSNTTEAGIAFDPACAFADAPCASFPGKLTQLMYRRWQNGLPGFILLPCELIDANGEALKKCVLQYAAHWGLEEGFVRWIEKENTFANTLVDRIVTGYPAEEAAKHPEDKYLDAGEIFHLWVVEGDFEGELPLKKAGFNVVWTDDVKPYKKIKVRILNGAHTSMVAGALLGGIETVGECMADETVSAYLRMCMEKEILPAIGDNEESRAFAQSVFDRFSNPFIRHQLRSIALNSVSKFGVRVLPTILEYKERFGVYPKGLVMALAFLIEFYRSGSPNDAPEVVVAMQRDSIGQILSNTQLWPCDCSDMAPEIVRFTEKIKLLGAKGVMQWILSE